MEMKKNNWIHKVTGTKYDEYGWTADGFNRSGYDREGFSRKGYNRYYFDRYGRRGIDRNGYDKSGFSTFDKRHKITGTKYDEQGYDWQGCNKNGEWLEGLGSIWDVVGICQ